MINGQQEHAGAYIASFYKSGKGFTRSEGASTRFMFNMLDQIPLSPGDLTYVIDELWKPKYTISKGRPSYSQGMEKPFNESFSRESIRTYTVSLFANVLQSPIFRSVTINSREKTKP